MYNHLLYEFTCFGTIILRRTPFYKLMDPFHFHIKHTQVHHTVVINGEHYRKTVKVNRADPCPLQQRHTAQTCYRLLLCLLLFHEGVTLHTSTHISSDARVHWGDSRDLLRHRASFFCYRPCWLTLWPQLPLCGFPEIH